MFLAGGVNRVKPHTLLLLWSRRDKNKSPKSFQAEHFRLKSCTGCLKKTGRCFVSNFSASCVFRIKVFFILFNSPIHADYESDLISTPISFLGKEVLTSNKVETPCTYPDKCNQRCFHPNKGHTDIYQCTHFIQPPCLKPQQLVWGWVRVRLLMISMAYNMKYTNCFFLA